MGAYDELVRRYQERIYATVYHMTSNHEDANDLTQDSFIKAYSGVEIVQGRFEFLHLALPDRGQQDHQFPQAAKNRTHMSLNNMDFNAEHDPDLVALVSDKRRGGTAGLSGVAGKIERGVEETVRTP